MQFPKIRITVEDRINYPHYNIVAIFGIKLIAALPTEYLLEVIRPGYSSSPECVEIANHMGSNTNHYWVIGAVADELCFVRNVISQDQYNVLTD